MGNCIGGQVSTYTRPTLHGTATYTQRGSGPVEVKHDSTLTRARESGNARANALASFIRPGENPTTNEVLKSLRKRGVDRRSFEAIQQALVFLVPDRDFPIMRFIHAACAEAVTNDVFDKVEFLLDMRIIDGNLHGPNGGTLLHAVTGGHPGNPSRLFSESLSDATSSINRFFTIVNRVSRIDKQDNNKQTALHLACIRDNGAFIHLLEHYGAKANLKDKFGRTAESYRNPG